MKGEYAYYLQWVIIDSKYWILQNPSYGGSLPIKTTK